MRDDARDDRFAPYSTADLTVNVVPIARLTLVMIVLRVQLGFKRADALKQVFFNGGPEQALDAAIRGCRARAGDDHQAHPALLAGFAIIRIGMSASLTENHY